MLELEIELVDGGELNFNQSFLKFNVNYQGSGKPKGIGFLEAFKIPIY